MPRSRWKPLQRNANYLDSSVALRRKIHKVHEAICADKDDETSEEANKDVALNDLSLIAKEYGSAHAI